MANIDLTADVLGELEDRLGVQFNNRRLLRQALVHRSLINEAELSDTDSNERLEFLGDAALGLVAAQMLYERYPDRAEGRLSQARASLVNTAALAGLGRDIELGRYLQLGRGEDLGGGRTQQTVLGRAYEAVLGAIYLDQGIDGLRALVTPLFNGILDRHGWSARGKDYKSRLQEALQGSGRSTPLYRMIGEQGPDHDKQFRMAVDIDGETLAEGEGSSKQRAEQDAARAALAKLAPAEEPVNVSAPD